MEKCSRAVPCSHGVVQRSTLASHIKRAHPSVHSELMMAGASSQESREERKDAVMITGEVVGVCVRCSLFSVFTYRFEQQQPLLRSHGGTERALRA